MHQGHDFDQAPNTAGTEPVQRITESRERLRVAACPARSARRGSIVHPVLPSRGG